MKDGPPSELHRPVCLAKHLFARPTLLQYGIGILSFLLLGVSCYSVITVATSAHANVSLQQFSGKVIARRPPADAGTPTITDTSSPTVTTTPSATPTNTPSPTPTTTSTPTTTPTNTPSPTVTNTPSPTSTSTGTPNPSPTTTPAAITNGICWTNHNSWPDTGKERDGDSRYQAGNRSESNTRHYTRSIKQ